MVSHQQLRSLNCSFLVMMGNAVYMVRSTSPSNPVLQVLIEDSSEVDRLIKKSDYPLLIISENQDEDSSFIYNHEVIYSFCNMGLAKIMTEISLVLPEFFYLRDEELKAFIAAKKETIISWFNSKESGLAIFDLGPYFPNFQEDDGLAYYNKFMPFFEFFFSACVDANLPMIKVCQDKEKPQIVVYENGRISMGYEFDPNNSDKILLAEKFILKINNVKLGLHNKRRMA